MKTLLLPRVYVDYCLEQLTLLGGLPNLTSTRFSVDSRAFITLPRDENVSELPPPTHLIDLKPFGVDGTPGEQVAYKFLTATQNNALIFTNILMRPGDRYVPKCKSHFSDDTLVYCWIDQSTDRLMESLLNEFLNPPESCVLFADGVAEELLKLSGNTSAAQLSRIAERISVAAVPAFHDGTFIFLSGSKSLPPQLYP